MPDPKTGGGSHATVSASGRVFARRVGSTVKHPQDRIEAVRPAVEKLGGKIINAWFAFGEYDVVVVTEMPDNVSAAGISMAFAGGGACKAVQTTPLLSVQEAVEAMKKAGQSGYRPAKVAARAA